MRLEHAIRIGNIVLGAVNIALFFLWWSLIRKDTIVPTTDASTYILNQVSMQVTALGAMIALGALLLAGLGIFGFQVAKENAENRADAAAKAAVAARWEEFKRQFSPTLQFNQGLTIQAVPPEGGRAQEEGRDI